MVCISVIVAVYAAEKYLSRCLDSIRDQTFSNFEVILVDDGSIDNSGEICDTYSSLDSRFKTIHKKNGGVGSARQCGLEHSTGEFVIHVDPDDWIEPSMLEELYRNAVENNSDMVICDMFSHFYGKKTYMSQKPSSLEPKVVLRDLFGSLHGSCCNKLVRRNCFKKYDICFPRDMVVWEDLFVIANLVMHDIRISYIPKAFYHYMQSTNENSIVKTTSRKKLDSMRMFIEFFDKIESFDKSLLQIRKIEMKRTAFLLEDVSKKEFFELSPDVNHLFVKKFKEYRKIDCLIGFSLKYSWPIGRFLLIVWKKNPFKGV